MKTLQLALIGVIAAAIIASAAIITQSQPKAVTSAVTAATTTDTANTLRVIAGNSTPYCLQSCVAPDQQLQVTADGSTLNF